MSLFQLCVASTNYFKMISILCSVRQLPHSGRRCMEDNKRKLIENYVILQHRPLICAEKQVCEAMHIIN